MSIKEAQNDYFIRPGAKMSIKEAQNEALGPKTPKMPQGA